MRVHRLLLTGLAVVGLAACSAGASGDATTAAPTAAVAPTTAPAASPTPAPTGTPASNAPSSAPATPASPLEDVWHTPVLKAEAAWATLREAGLQKWVQPLRAIDEAPGATNQYTLRITNGRWILYESRDGEPAQEIDAGTYTIDGDGVTVHHYAGNDMYAWIVDGDTLRLTVTGDDIGDYKGIPEEVFQTYLYMSSPFTRGAS